MYAHWFLLCLVVAICDHRVSATYQDGNVADFDESVSMMHKRNFYPSAQNSPPYMPPQSDAPRFPMGKPGQRTITLHSVFSIAKTVYHIIIKVAHAIIAGVSDLFGNSHKEPEPAPNAYGAYAPYGPYGGYPGYGGLPTIVVPQDTGAFGYQG